MFEKVNPSHPDKLADRIAGAFVDRAYRFSDNPSIAVEVLLGHGEASVIIESSVLCTQEVAARYVQSITKGQVTLTSFKCVEQDVILTKNQYGQIKCGDNGIFKGVPVGEEEKFLTHLAKRIYRDYPYDGKYLVGTDGTVTICQSRVPEAELKQKYPFAIVNPLGDWIGGLDVDSGATNRKLGSDMGASITGGGLHGKDLSKADVSVNIYAWLKAQATGKPIEISCSIGDEFVDGIPYENIVRLAKAYIHAIGGFEKFAEWGFVI